MENPNFGVIEVPERDVRDFVGVVKGLLYDPRPMIDHPAVAPVRHALSFGWENLINDYEELVNSRGRKSGADGAERRYWGGNEYWGGFALEAGLDSFKAELGEDAYFADLDLLKGDLGIIYPMLRLRHTNTRNFTHLFYSQMLLTGQGIAKAYGGVLSSENKRKADGEIGTYWPAFTEQQRLTTLHRIISQ